MSRSPLVIIILGPSGSGKGTQAELLAKKFNLDYVGSGRLLRERMGVKDFTGREINRSMNGGSFLVPTFIIFKLWVDQFEKLKKKNNFKGFIMDGSPRKIFEARLIDEVLAWYGWNKNIKIFWVDISLKETIRRLLQRGRRDDSLAGIKKRLSYFKSEVGPVINYYQKTRKVIRINGEQSRENVFRDILNKLKA